MPYSGATNILLDALVRKKYALPRSVISALYDWIMQFDSYENKLPVVWFQTVLHICQAYGSNLF
jgi:essential nuclear protein 1